MKICARNSSF